jgi:dTDP-4-dehydrorhamnose reductase
LAAQPDIIISAAAYTAVDKAESEPDLAHTVNGLAVGELGRIAKSLDIPILHLSTDYVFSGDKQSPYTEDDVTGPLSVYGKTKLEGEKALIDATANHVILRTAWVYSPFGANFVKTMLRLAETHNNLNVVGDQFGCPTSALAIANALLHIAHRVKSDPDQKLRGIYHLTAQGQASWAEFAAQIFAGLYQRTGKTVVVTPIPSENYPTPAKRPKNSRLSGEKLSQYYDYELPSWQKSLDACLDILIKPI